MLSVSLEFIGAKPFMKPVNMQGFTLIEAMITLTLIAITLSLALPSYRGYVIRANRTEAIETLLATAACQERIYTRTNAYDANACRGDSSNGFYAISVATSNGNQNFVATAAPQDTQTEDNCGSLTINQTGVKTAGGQSGSFASTCWRGKSSSAGS